MGGCAESHMMTAEVASVIVPHTLHTNIYEINMFVLVKEVYSMNTHTLETYKHM